MKQAMPEIIIEKHTIMVKFSAKPSDIVKKNKRMKQAMPEIIIEKHTIND